MSEFAPDLAGLTPEQLELLALLLQEEGVDVTQVAIAPQARPDGRAALSFAQQRLWFLDQLTPGSAMYNIPAAVRLTGRLNIDALRRALNEVVRRHEALRTTFGMDGDEPVQIIHPELDVPLPVVDLRAASREHAEIEAEAQRLIVSDARQPFNLATGPLLRAMLVRLADDDHILVTNTHHIVSDGWSVGVLVSEMAALYAAFCRGEAVSPLPPLPVQYADFAIWQRSWLAGEKLQAQLAYWRKQLGGEAPVLQLPTDRPRPAIPSARGDSHTFWVSKRLADKLGALGQREGATPFMTLLAAFQTLLYRYTGQEDIAVGTPIANRGRAEIEGLIGFFVNTLVLRNDLGGGPSFRQLLARVRKTAVDAYANQDVPFEMLVEALQPGRDLGHTPFFQVMFALQNTPSEPARLPDLTMAQVQAHSGTATFDLTLVMGETPDGLNGAIEYDTDIFDATTIERMAGHFGALLEAIVAEPDQPITRLPIMTEAERRQVLVEWNATAAEFPADRLIHQLFEEQVIRTPDAIALIDPGLDGPVSRQRTELTYADLNARANQLAHHLRSLGVGPESLVGLMVERSPEMVIGLLGILKAGGAYLPLDPAYPADRIAFMIRDSGLQILLTQQRLIHSAALRDQMEDRPSAIVCLDADWPEITQQLTSPPLPLSPSPCHPERSAAESKDLPLSQSLAYVIYTSGSTGVPKGVGVEHHSVLNHNVATARLFGLTPADRVLQFATINFDAAIEEIFPALQTGATLVLRPDSVLTTGEELLRLIEQERITVLDFPTAYWHQWVQELAQIGATVPDHVRLLVVGGDAAAPDKFAAWLALGGGHVTWLNTYGPTETTIISTWYEPPRGLAAWDANIPLPIGRPLPNTQLYVLDHNLEPVPVGVPGELFIGGAGVTRGYLNRPELTAERFVPNPFVGDQEKGRGGEGERGRILPPLSLSPLLPLSGARLYRTGDLVRWRADGDLEFLGRTDFQVKLRGMRIELGEVTAALAQLPVVADCAVLAQESATGKRLVAYIVPKRSGVDAALPDGAPTTALVSDLRAGLAQRLPDYMLPSAYVVLDALPRSASGKLDRRRLPEPEPISSEAGEAHAKPRTPTEEMLTSLWERLLQSGPVRIHDNFFDLGGHSLLATQLISRLRAAFQVELPVRALFERPTIAGLAAAIEDAQRQAQGMPAPAMRPALRDGASLPLSFGQQRLWFLDQLEPDSPLYNIPDAVRIEGALDVPALARSLNEIIRRHEILRTSFPTLDGIPQLAIKPALTLDVPVTDLSGLPDAERTAAVREHIVTEARRPFNLAQGPLLRASLLRLGPEEHIALVTMHHIVSDGWSAGVLTRELVTLYTSLCGGEAASPLPPLPVQYADFAYWQRNWLAGDVLRQQLDYWKTTLADLPAVLELPTDRPRPAMQTVHGAHLTFCLPIELATGLKALSRSHDATLFMTVLAGFQVLLSRYSGQEVFGIGTPIANRNRAEIENLIGFFVNTLVLRADLNGSPSFRELLKRVRETALGAYAHQDLPFEMVVDALQPQRDLSHTPLFQVMFTLQSARHTQSRLELPGLRFSELEVDTGVAPFDLTLTLSEDTEGLSGGIEYNPDLFDETTIRRMLGHLQTLLEGAIAHPDAAVTRLPMLSPGEREQILGAWNDTAAAHPAHLGMHQLFEVQAAGRPDAIALVQPALPGTSEERRTFTYAELNARANQLADHLRSLGVGPESLVGLMVERSPEMVIGLLGILKAGGAYLPLDPAYPADRIAFMIRDSGLQILLTQQRLIHSAALRDQMEDRPSAIVCLDADWPEIAQQLTSPPLPLSPSPCHPERSAAESKDLPLSQSLAYVIYTSGSTGVPKGVGVEHHSVLNHNVATARLFGLTPADRVLQFATINFDAAIEEMFPTWHAGGAVVLRPSGALLATHELLDLIATEGLTVLDLPTAYWHELTSELEHAGALPPTLRLVIAGGDKASGERLAAWQRVAGSVRWLNTYGPTEGSIIASSFEPSLAEVWPADAEIPIGRPIDNAKLYILDRHGELVPIGVPGELHIGGMAVARGYLGRPELTAEKFVPNPFAPSLSPSPVATGEGRGGGTPAATGEGRGGSARLYCTGDRARWRSDGNIEFLGRVDTQVKIRGFRVEPGEIEAVIQQHPSVRECAVAVRQDEGAYKRLVAYAAPIAGTELTAAMLRAFLRERLPEYMAPAAYVVLDKLPRSPAGKVDRRALPAPDQVQYAAEGAAYTPPQGEIEETLAGIWAQVLGLPKVGVDDNFFELGGDSILSIQVIARANQAGLRLTPRQLFEHPTVAGLAIMAGRGPTVRAEQGLVTGPVPLTPIQQWFFEQHLSDAHHWNQALLLELRSEGVPLEPGHLAAAVVGLVTHHDALRLRFRVTGSGNAPQSGGSQYIEQTNTGTDGPPVFAHIDLSSIPGADRQTAIETEAARLQASLALANGPIIRVAHFDLGPDDPGRLLVVVHHLAMDGVSWRILLEDLQTAYRQAATGASIRLPAKTTSFQAWARRLTAHARSEIVLAELPYWLEIARHPIEPLPVDFVPPVTAPNGDEASERIVQVALTEAETQALLHQALPAFRAEINDVLLAGLAHALRNWTGSQRVLVELEGHGREEIAADIDVSRTLGWFTCVFPAALDLRSARQPADVVRAVKDALHQVPNRGIGFGLLRYLADVTDEIEALRAMPQPEISFNYLGQLDQALNEDAPFRPARESRGPDRSLRGGRIYPLEVNGGIMGGRLQLSLSYSEALHRRDTMERLGRSYADALRAIIAQAQAPDSPAEAALRPEDFPLAKLDRKDLAKVLGKLGKTGGNVR